MLQKHKWNMIKDSVAILKIDHIFIRHLAKFGHKYAFVHSFIENKEKKEKLWFKQRLKQCFLLPSQLLHTSHVRNVEREKRR